MSQTRPILLLIALICCCVTCRNDEENKNLEFHDEFDDFTEEQWNARHRKSSVVLDNQLASEEANNEDVTKTSVETHTRKKYVVNTKDDLHKTASDESDSEDEYDDKHYEANQSAYKDEESDESYDSMLEMQKFGHPDGKQQQNEKGEQKDVLSLSSRGHYPSVREQKADPSMCSGKKDGVHEGGPCEQWYLSCRKGQAKRIFCGDGLYWNGDEGRCEPKNNIHYCRLKFDCTGLDDNLYVDGCSNIFWLCASETASISKCPKGLYFNAKEMKCDLKKNIAACGDTSEDGKKSTKFSEKNFKKFQQETRWQIAYTVTEPYQKHRVCQSRKNGEHAITKCSRKYLLCIDGKGMVVKCPSGHLYSRQHGRCMDAGKLPFCAGMVDLEVITSAGYDQQKTKEISSIVGLPSHRFILCSSLSDGSYQLGNCEKRFVVCLNGVGIDATCSMDLAFNGRTRQCDYMHNIETCFQYRKGERRVEESAASNENRDCRCEGRKDGLYAVGCTGKFYSCSNGISRGLECPADLVFNVDGGFCDHPKNVIACGSHVIRIVDKEKEELELISGCSILDDGIYGLSPCGSGYYHCWRGATSFAKCAFGLVFNPSLERCDFRENVRGCPQYNSALAKAHMQMNGFTIIPAEDGASNCKEMDDGFYVEGCSRIYYGCSNGETFYMSCPLNLVFNHRSGTCEERKNVQACRNVTRVNGVELSSSAGTTQPMLSCSVLPNGPHQLDLCLAHYILCHDGITRLVSCPGPMVFNSDNLQCDWPANVVACGRADQSNGNHLDVQCSGQPDGIFSERCSKNFHVCAKETIYRLTCPDGMVYNSKVGRCEDPLGVQACIQSQISTASVSATPSNHSTDHPKSLLPSSGGTVAEITDMGIVDDDDCDNCPDGNYADGPCSNIFFACSNAVKIPMICPEMLAFDARTNRCEDRMNIPQCRSHEDIPEDVPFEGYDSAERVMFSGATPYLDRHVCTGRKNGVYPLENCLESYLRCCDQKASVRRCPNKTVFDGSTSACISKAACIPTTASSATDRALLTNENSKSIEPSEEDVEQAAPNFRELANGDYSARCVAHFVTRFGSSEIHRKCPNPMVFSNVLRRCVPYNECAFLENRISASSRPLHTVFTQFYDKKGNATIAPSASHQEVLQPSPRLDVDCWNLPDGDYSHGCSSTYTICFNGTKIVRGCSTGQIYDPNSKRCVFSPGCPDVPLGSTSKVSVMRQRVDSDVPANMDCGTLNDGLYSLGVCLTKFVKCANGRTFVYDCPADLFYDEEMERCEYSEACSTRRLVVTQEPTSVNCSTLNDGLYSLGVCLTKFVKCTNGRSFVYGCPADLVFDGNTGRCEYAETCGIMANTTQVSVKKQEVKEKDNGQNYFCIRQLSHSKAGSVSCDELNDGLYALPCSNKVVVCNGGKKAIRRCRNKGHVFVPEFRKCDLPTKCKKIRRCKLGTVSVVYIGKLRGNMPSDKPPVADGFSCMNQPDGNYGEQCSSTYIRCLRGAAIPRMCNEGRFFDQRANVCMVLVNCSLLANNANFTKIPCVEGEHYGNGYCSDFYYTCQNGGLVMVNCPAGETFNAALGVCGNNCDRCDCESTEPTNTTATTASTAVCEVGEVKAVGSCMNSYMECNKQRTFVEKHCEEGKFFDPSSLFCRIPVEIVSCSTETGITTATSTVSSGTTSIVSTPQPQYHVVDSFKSPSHLSSNWQSIYPMQLPQIQIPSGWLAFQPPYSSSGTSSGTSGVVQTAQYGSVFVPESASVPSVSSAFASAYDTLVRDGFLFVPAASGSSSFARTSDLRIVDAFRPPSGSASSGSSGSGSSSPSSGYAQSIVGSAFDSLSSNFNEEARINKAEAYVEGSGEYEVSDSSVKAVSRGKRDTSLEKELFELEPDMDPLSEVEALDELQELCRNKTHPVNIPLGFCRPDYIFCGEEENMGSLVICEDGKLFDSWLKSCVPAPDCKRGTQSSQDFTTGITPCALLPDGTYALPGCSQHFFSCLSNKAFLRTCVSELYYDGIKQECDYKERVAACSGSSTSSRYETGEINTAVTRAVHEAPSVLPNFACTVDSTLSLGCSPSFILCVSGTAYMFHCDGGLVFNLATSSCNRMELTTECDSQHFPMKTVPVIDGFRFSPSPLSLGESGPFSRDLPDLSENLVNISDASSFDCTNARDGVHTFQCSPLFFVCSAGQITGFVCQDALVFNLETGFCDQKEYVASCDGTHAINSLFTLSSATQMPPKSSFITTQPSYRSASHRRQKCEVGFSGVISTGCSQEFTLCAHGLDHLFVCQQGLMYNIETNRCDYAQNIAACKSGSPFYSKRAYGASHFANGSVSSIRIVDLRSVGPSDDAMKARCEAIWGQAAAYGRCRMDYIACPKDGVAHKSYCVSGYLFDEDVGRCVPAELCGTVGYIVAEPTPLTKGMCDNVEDGVTKGSGPCLSYYYVCKRGVPIRRRCFKHLETFSAVAGSCVARSQNPECPGYSIILTDGIRRASNIDDFCIHRPDGMYRHPADCARVLQCFGEEVFEHLPCSDGLVFNELSGGCDYKSSVPECVTTTSTKFREAGFRQATGPECQGRSHGDILVDEDDCSVYYRCVWGRLEKVACPEHTVFNPLLSVCDFPNEVPYCKVTL